MGSLDVCEWSHLSHGKACHSLKKLNWSKALQLTVVVAEVVIKVVWNIGSNNTSSRIVVVAVVVVV